MSNSCVHSPPVAWASRPSAPAERPAPARSAGTPKPRGLPGPPRRRGVTLVEVLATLVLVGIVLPVAMHGITLSMQAASRARHLTEAGQLAEAKLNEVLALRDVNTLTGAGDFGADWPEYRWTSEYVSADFGTYEVTVTVLWTERGQERSVTLSTLVYPSGTSL